MHAHAGVSASSRVAPPTPSHPPTPGSSKPYIEQDPVETKFAAMAAAQIHKNRVSWRNVTRMTEEDFRKQVCLFLDGHRNHIFFDTHRQKTKNNTTMNTNTRNFKTRKEVSYDRGIEKKAVWPILAQPVGPATQPAIISFSDPTVLAQPACQRMVLP